MLDFKSQKREKQRLFRLSIENHDNLKRMADYYSQQGPRCSEADIINHLLEVAWDKFKTLGELKDRKIKAKRPRRKSFRLTLFNFEHLQEIAGYYDASESDVINILLSAAWKQFNSSVPAKKKNGGDKFAVV